MLIISLTLIKLSNSQASLIANGTVNYGANISMFDFGEDWFFSVSQTNGVDTMNYYGNGTLKNTSSSSSIGGMNLMYVIAFKNPQNNLLYYSRINFLPTWGKTPMVTYMFGDACNSFRFSMGVVLVDYSYLYNSSNNRLYFIYTTLNSPTVQWVSTNSSSANWTNTNITLPSITHCLDLAIIWLL